MNLLQFFEDPRGPEEKGSLLRIRTPNMEFLNAILIRIPPRKVVVIPVKKIEKSSGENKESEHA